MSVILIKIRKYVSIMLIMTLLISSCEGKNSVTLSPIYALNTVFNRTIFECDGEAITADKNTAEILNDADLVFNRFNEKSELSKLNTDKEITPSKDLSEVLKIAQNIEKESDGSFSCLMGDISDAWDFENGTIPDITLTQNSITVTDDYVTISGGSVDLGAVAKGYVIDKIVEEYKNNGVTRAVVSCGSSVGIIGEATVGIRNPDGNQSDIIGKITLTDCAVSTSGDYEKFFIRDGVRYHHILDPKTGFPANNGLRAVTVIGENGAMADALSTAAFVLGYEKGSLLLERFGYEGIFITEDKTIVTTLDITLTDENYEMGKN